tara:strand:- start:1105 stop:1281 length:177 start_codon:yes stop_codon:yes gene_type:complete
MGISERTKRLLNWWQLRIEKSREETKEKNVERNDTATDSTVSVCMGSKDNERRIEEKE